MQPQRIVITGASSGLGATLARLYAHPETVLGLVGRDLPRLSDIADSCRQRGAKVITAKIDVTDKESMETWLHQFDDVYPIDLCIANAGVSAGTGGTAGETLSQVHAIFSINVDGTFNTIHPIIERMLERGRGQIGMVSSISGFRGSPTAPAYSTSKAALRYYGQALRGLLGPSGIKVNVICPGFIKTPMTDVNDFPMPFMMTTEEAGHIIQKGLARDKALIAFPWKMAFLARLQNWLPDRLINYMYRKMPAKPASPDP